MSDTLADEVEVPAIDDEFISFAELKAKPKRTHTFPVLVPDGNGGQVSKKMRYQAIPAKEYDALLAKFPPTAEQRERGETFNMESFGPALISAVSLNPKLTVEQARELYTDPDWAGGEVTTLYMNALRVCNAGLDVPFNERG